MRTVPRSRGMRLLCAITACGLLVSAAPAFASTVTDDTSVTLTVTAPGGDGTTGGTGGGTSGGSSGGGGGGASGVRKETAERKIEEATNGGDGGGMASSSSSASKNTGRPAETPAPTKPVEVVAPEEAGTSDGTSGGTPYLLATNPVHGATEKSPLDADGIREAAMKYEQCTDPLTCLLSEMSRQTQDLVTAATGQFRDISPVKVSTLSILFILMAVALHMLYVVTGRLNRSKSLMQELAVTTVHYNGWYILNVGILLLLAYIAVMLFEFSRAADTTIRFVVTSGDTTLSCSTSVSIGSLQETGDTGAFSTSRAATCTVSTTNTNGYSLTWNVATGSGGTFTGSLISADEERIQPYDPLIDGTPETWNVPTDEARWGARLSSTSDTVSTAVWGIDGSSEKWLNVGTGSFTIASRSNANSGNADDELIGFRAEIGSNSSKPAGSYQTTVTFTATGN